jgi:transcriptional regulator GlxA family with amidase domain
VREARCLLEVSGLPVDEVAARTGLGSAANLRLHLARDAGTTRGACRRSGSCRGRPSAGCRRRRRSGLG